MSFLVTLLLIDKSTFPSLSNSDVLAGTDPPEWDVGMTKVRFSCRSRHTELTIGRLFVSSSEDEGFEGPLTEYTVDAFNVEPTDELHGIFA